MNCATCFPNFVKTERSAKWQLRLPWHLQEGLLVSPHGQEVTGEATTGLHVTIGTGTVIEDSRDMHHLDMMIDDGIEIGQDHRGVVAGDTEDGN
jgi:hypothetical protein